MGIIMDVVGRAIADPQGHECGQGYDAQHDGGRGGAGATVAANHECTP